MNLKQLETFVWIVRLGSFTAAASKLNTTQPAITTRVKQLEKSLNTALFDEPRRVARLTPAGRDLLEYAVRILHLTSEAQARIGDPASVAGRIRVGVGEVVALSWFPDFIAQLNAEFPKLVIETEVDLTKGLWSKFDQGELELLLLPGPERSELTTSQDLGFADFSWVASPNLKLPERKILRPADLQGQSIITLSQNSILYQIAEDWFRAASFEPKRIDICNSMAAVASLTVSGLGISILPPQIYKHEIEQGRLIELKTEPKLDSVSYISVHRKDREYGLVQMVADVAVKCSNFPKI